jgi:hypothetical protein
MTQSSGERLAILERVILRRIFGPFLETDLRYRLSHNKELQELLDLPDTVKYIQFEKLQWVDLLV